MENVWTETALSVLGQSLRNGVTVDYAEGFPAITRRVCTAHASEVCASVRRIQHTIGWPALLPVRRDFHHIVNATTGGTAMTNEVVFAGGLGWSGWMSFFAPDLGVS